MKNWNMELSGQGHVHRTGSQEGNLVREPAALGMMQSFSMSSQESMKGKAPFDCGVLLARKSPLPFKGSLGEGKPRKMMFLASSHPIRGFNNICKIPSWYHLD